MKFYGSSHATISPFFSPPGSDVLGRDLSGKEFNNNDTRGPKSVSAFIVRLSELAPRLVIKQMTLLIKQLESEVGLWLC